VALTPATHLVDELGIDSARMIDIVLNVEDAFDIIMNDEEINSTRTFGDLLELVRSKTQMKGAAV
jgi:acyl carrier protein